MNKLIYLYEFDGSLIIDLGNKFFKIKNKRISSDIELIYLNKELYFGEELKIFDEISFNNERIIIFKDFIISSIVLPLNKYEVKYEKLKDREIFIPKYNDKEIKPNLEINLKKINLIPVNRNVSFISFLPMVMMSLASLSVVILNIYQKNHEFIIKDNLNQLILPIVMLVSTLVLQPLIRYLEKRRNRKENNRKVEEYKKYLLKKSEAVKTFKTLNDKYLNNLYLDQDVINKNIKDKKIYFYQKSDDGYLNLSLGRGTINLENLKIKNNNNEENEIGIISNEFVIKSTKANTGPILLDLKSALYPTVVSNGKDFFYFDFLLLSIFSSINPKDIKVACLISEEYIDHFSYLYDIKHLMYDQLCHVYKKDERQYKDADLLIVIGKNFNPHLNKSQKVLTLVEKIEDVPALTKELIVINKDFGSIKRNEQITEFHFKQEKVDILEFIKLSNRYFYQPDLEINSIIPLTDLYPIDYSPNTLKAVLGINNQGVVTLDLDETRDGPHGLICGMTGSGKSELLLTLVLSLSLNYSPNYLNFVVIDFKGGGIVNILNNKERKLKHLINSLTNIDGIDFERILVSFKNEIYKRQNIFKQASEISGENITNIKEYLSLLKRGVVFKPLPHLLIILDEFAEIKKEHNEVIEEFLSISRVGRSLGIHLVLCTQRAQGIIDEEIKSNSGFKICLKVNSKEDSREVIDTEDAIDIKEKGGFYLLTNNYYLYGKSAYTNADINKSYLKKTEITNQNFEVIDKCYSVKLDKSITEATRIIDVLNKKYSKIDLSENKLWLEPLNNLKRNEKTNEDYYSFGIVDDYKNKKQYLASINTSTNNLVISFDKKKKEQHLINCLNDLALKDIDVYLLNFSKYKIDNSNIIEITEKDEYELNYLINLLSNNKDRFFRKTLIIISDLKSLQAYSEKMSDILKQVIEMTDNNHYKFLIYTNNSSDYTYSFSMLFDRLIYLGDFKSDEVLNIYSKTYKNNSSNDGLININELEEFKLFDEPLIISDKQNTSLIKYIPDKRKLIVNESGILIGYTCALADEFYLKTDAYKKIIMFSYDEELIEILKEIFKEYKNVKVLNADDARTNKSELRSSMILFYGSGVIDNYDLNKGLKEDLEEDEMLFIYKKEKVRIKYFNEWD